MKYKDELRGKIMKLGVMSEPLSEVLLSDLFHELYKDQLYFISERSAWYRYNGAFWEQDNQLSTCLNYLIKMLDTLQSVARSVFDDDDKQLGRYSKQITGYKTRAKLNNILGLAERHFTIPESEFDASDYLVNFKNGTFNLETMKLQEHDPADKLLSCSIANYNADYDKNGRFIRFVSEIMEGDKDKIDFLQRAFGYGLCGRQKEECFFVLYGKTSRNGKSTLIEAVNKAMNNYCKTTGSGLLLRTGTTLDGDGEQATPMLASLKGRRYAFLSETSENKYLDDERIKRLTGGDSVTARHLYGSQFEFVPKFKMYLATNSLPRVKDDMIFRSGRVKIIEFCHHFTPEEQDHNLKETLESNECLEQIVGWLVDGYRAYLERGLATDTNTELEAQYEHDNNTVLQFTDDMQDAIVGCTRGSVLYNVYANYCRENSIYAMSRSRFYQQIERQGFTRVNRHKQTYFVSPDVDRLILKFLSTKTGCEYKITELADAMTDEMFNGDKNRCPRALIMESLDKLADRNLVLRRTIHGYTVYTQQPS